MPSELRVLLYSDQEVVAALAAYYRKAGKPLTIGQISRFDIIDEQDVAVDLEIETMSRETVQHFIPSKDLVAALLLQAGTAKVTLPTEAEKRIYVIENQISLVIHTRRSKSEAPRRATGQTTGIAGASRV